MVVPLRVPPPIAATVSEQWIIDALLHLDDCVDDGKKQSSKQIAELKAQFTEFRAEVTAALTAKNTEHVSIMERLRHHEDEHKALEEVKKARASVWKVQGRWIAWAVEKLTQGGVIGGVVWVLTQVF